LGIEVVGLEGEETNALGHDVSKVPEIDDTDLRRLGSNKENRLVSVILTGGRMKNSDAADRAEIEKDRQRRKKESDSNISVYWRGSQKRGRKNLGIKSPLEESLAESSATKF